MMKQRNAEVVDFIRYLECYLPEGSRYVYGDLTLTGSGEKMDQTSHVGRHLAWDDEAFERKYSEYVAFKKEQKSLGIIPEDDNEWLYSAFSMPWQSYNILFLTTMLKEENMSGLLSWANNKKSEREYRVVRHFSEPIGRYRKYGTNEEGECLDAVLVFRKGYYNQQMYEHTLQACVYLATCFPLVK